MLVKQNNKVIQVIACCFSVLAYHTVLHYTVMFIWGMGLLYQDLQYSNKSTLALSLFLAYSFGKPSLRLLQERIENQLYINLARYLSVLINGVAKMGVGGTIDHLQLPSQRWFILDKNGFDFSYVIGFKITYLFALP